MEHIDYLQVVLQTLCNHKLFGKLSKCKFMKTSVEYLEYIISKEGISIDQRKIETINKWTLPQNIAELQSFLGLASYYRKLIKGFSSIAIPLTQLLHKNMPYVWTDHQEMAFNDLK